jgi:hypothetical protein
VRLCASSPLLPRSFLARKKPPTPLHGWWAHWCPASSSSTCPRRPKTKTIAARPAPCPASPQPARRDVRARPLYRSPSRTPSLAVPAIHARFVFVGAPSVMPWLFIVHRGELLPSYPPSPFSMHGGSVPSPCSPAELTTLWSRPWSFPARS